MYIINYITTIKQDKKFVNAYFFYIFPVYVYITLDDIQIATVLQRLILDICKYDYYFCQQINKRIYENPQNKSPYG